MYDKNIRKKTSKRKKNKNIDSFGANASTTEMSTLDTHLDKHVTDNEVEVNEQILETESNILLKRDLDESDVEDKPKKKKKKKNSAIETSGTNNKGKKSIRQMKREKYAQRQIAAETLAKNALKQECIQYLWQWKNDRQNWKFMKSKQIWLFKNKFSIYLIPEDIWPILLSYFESAQGNIRKMLLNDANDVIKAMDTWMEIQTSETSDITNTENVSEETVKKPDEISYKRARDVIQNIEE